MRDAANPSPDLCASAHTRLYGRHTQRRAQRRRDRLLHRLPDGRRLRLRRDAPDCRVEDRAAVHPTAGARRHAAAGQAASAPGEASKPASQTASKAGAASGRGAPTDAQVRRELEQAFGSRGGRAIDAAGLGSEAWPPSRRPRRRAWRPSSTRPTPFARKPYVYGGGHGRLAGETFVDSAYDCSGSVSFALAAAGLVDSPMDSTALARFGRPARGAGSRSTPTPATRS